MEGSEGLRRSIKTFLDLQSITPVQPTQCERCGSTMEYSDTHFWLYETEMQWSIPLPRCPACDPQQPSRGEQAFVVGNREKFSE